MGCGSSTLAATVAKDSATVAKDSATVAKDSATVAKDSATVAKDCASVAKDSDYASETSFTNTLLQATSPSPSSDKHNQTKEEAKMDEIEREERKNHETKIENILEGVRSLLKIFDAAKDREINEECEYNNTILRALASFSKYFQGALAKDVPMDIVNSYHIEICKLVEGSQVLDICCGIIIQCYARSQKSHFFISKSIELSKLTLLNMTNDLEKVAELVANYPEFLETVKQILQDATDTDAQTYSDMFELKKKEDGVAEEAVDDYIGIIHNLAISDSRNVARLRSLDMTTVLRPFLESSSVDLQISSLSALSGIVNEEESDIINANRHTVKALLDIFSKALTKKHRTWIGWGCRELAMVVRMLARNDANKPLLVQLGALEALVKLGQIGDDDEKIESTGAIWALCFDEGNRKKIVSDKKLGVVDLLIELGKSENKDIRKNCEGALWTLRKELKTSGVEENWKLTDKNPDKKSKVQKGRAQEKSSNKPEDSEGGHIMISYQWGNQETMKIIVARLRANNFKVWIDIERMGGSTLEAMAGAIEQASVVLICYSQKYKNSPNCRAEAEYAFQTSKPIIPLKMERGYKADGWLGMIIGTKLFYEFSPKYPFEDKVNQLLQALFEIYGQKIQPSKAPTVQAITQKQDDVDSGVVMATTATSVSMTTLAVAMETAEVVRRWQAKDVKSWIGENKLTGCKIDHLTGGEIALLLCMRVEAPECFYKTLREMLNINELLTMSKIVWALKDLSVKKLK